LTLAQLTALSLLASASLATRLSPRTGQFDRERLIGHSPWAMHIDMLIIKVALEARIGVVPIFNQQ
jgi:hypothetical protein